MTKYIINKETNEIVRRYYIESMFDKIKPKSNEYEILSEEVLDILTAYRYNTVDKKFEKIPDIEL